MRLDVLLWALVVMAFASYGMGLVITTTMGDYGRDYDDRIIQNITTESDTVLIDSMALSNSLKDNQQAKEVEDTNTEDNLLSGGYNTIINIWSFFTYPGRLLGTIATNLGLNKRIINLVMVMLGIGVTFAIVYLWFRFQPR